MRFDDSTEVLTITITWQPPENLGQFDFENYTVNILSTTGINESVCTDTPTWHFTDARKKRARFNVTVTATNRCGQTGRADSTTLEYEPSKKCHILACLHACSI